jgi:Universal stress protein UspA and related nucleotide-binding proteins
MTRVLIALDGSAVSVRAAHAAVELFGSDNEYFVVNVAAPALVWPEGVAYGGVYPMSGDEWTALTTAVDTAAQGTAESGATAAGITPAEIIVEHGDPVAAICDAADSHQADVIVVGSHDKGRLERLITPSIADAVVHHSSRPVLVVSGASNTDD